MNDVADQLDLIESEKPFSDPKANALESVFHWYSQIKNFEYKKPEKWLYLKEKDKFVQMVWKATREVGCGYGVSKDGKAIVVNCQYTPRGNRTGKVAKNVGKPK